MENILRRYEQLIRLIDFAAKFDVIANLIGF